MENQNIFNLIVLNFYFILRKPSVFFCVCAIFRFDYILNKFYVLKFLNDYEYLNNLSCFFLIESIPHLLEKKIIPQKIFESYLAFIKYL